MDIGCHLGCKTEGDLADVTLPLDTTELKHCRIHDIKPGAVVVYDTNGTVRVMAVAEGWAMVRRKGCAPFLIMCKELADKAFDANQFSAEECELMGLTGLELLQGGDYTEVRA